MKNKYEMFSIFFLEIYIKSKMSWSNIFSFWFLFEWKVAVQNKPL